MSAFATFRTEAASHGILSPRVAPEAAAAPAADGAAPAPEVAPAASAGPMKSADGANSLSGSGKQINVKGAQTCKSS
jgi:hypothetical protein